MDLDKSKLCRTLITGAGGFIGSHLARSLAAMDETEIVYCVDLPGSKRLIDLSNNSKIRIIEADLNNESSLFSLPDDVSGVFALAALNGTGRFYEKPFLVLESSILPTINIIKKYCRIAPIVYSSSSEVYASTVMNFNGAIPSDESIIPSIEDVHNPRWSYASAKLLGEIATNSASVEFGTNTAIVRYHNVYGPDMGTDHFIPDFIARAHNQKYEVIGGNETRAFMYISDAIKGTILALMAANTSAPIFHLGSREELSVLAAAQIILSEMNLEGKEVLLRPGREGSVQRRLANTLKAEEILKWKAEIDFRAGIRGYLSQES